MRVIVMVIKYLQGRVIEISYQEERFDELLPTAPKMEQHLVEINPETGEVTVAISRIAHE